jgi:hypothetical protein
MKTWKSLVYSLLSAVPLAALASQDVNVPAHQPSPEIVDQIWDWNLGYFRTHSGVGRLDPVPHQPVPEYDHFRYLLMTSDPSFNTGEFKQAIAQNLPSDMKLVLLTSPGDESSVYRTYTKWISKDRLIIASSSATPSGFWSRDAFPYPVYMAQGSKPSLVNAKYYRGFEGGQDVANAVKATNYKKSYVYVGGNLMADADGRCFVVDSRRRFGLPEEAYKQNYGCQKVIFFKYEAGIGDVDEVVKILPNHQALTNRPDYVPILQAEGYRVTMLPEAGGYRTYANSVILNGTVFMPAYGEPADEQAAAVYRSFGYKVVMADSRTVSDEGNGSFHCTTMAYPAINESALTEQLHLNVWAP